MNCSLPVNGFEIISWEDRPAEFLAAIASFGITEEQFNLNLKYRKVVAGEGFCDLSFCLAKENDIHLAILCHKTDNSLNFNNAPVCFFGNCNEKKIIVAACDELTRRALAAGAEFMRIADRKTERTISLMGAELFQRNGVPLCRLESAIDLKNPEEVIRSHLRESYKSLINQTRRDMVFIVLSRDNADKKLFDEFRKFHFNVSGRQTRTIESWNVQYDMIVAGCAEVVLGYIEPHGLVSSALFTDFGDTTTYAVAVYNRELFSNRSLAHANVYEGIVRAKNRGQLRFVLGSVPPKGTVTDKEYSIGLFKKGFCDRLESYIEWTIPLKASNLDVRRGT